MSIHTLDRSNYYTWGRRYIRGTHIHIPNVKSQIRSVSFIAILYIHKRSKER